MRPGDICTGPSIVIYVCYFVIKLLQLFRHIYVILYYLLWNVQCVCVCVCMCVCMCVYVDFLFFYQKW